MGAEKAKALFEARMMNMCTGLQNCIEILTTYNIKIHHEPNNLKFQKRIGIVSSINSKSMIPIRTTVVGSYPFPGWLEFDQ